MINLRSRRVTAGFTLIELLVTVSIVAILLSLAAPSFRNLILNQHVRTGASDLQITLFLARSEAIKRAVSVKVVPVNVGGSADWKNGWSSQLLDGTVLRNQVALNSQLSSMAGTTITYQNDGHVTAAPAPIIVRVSGNTHVTARCVVVDLSGRPSVVVDTDGDPANGCN